MNLARKEFAATRVARPTPTTKTNLKVIVGKKEEKTYTTEYLNERLAYFYANGGPIMDI